MRPLIHIINQFYLWWQAAQEHLEPQEEPQVCLPLWQEQVEEHVHLVSPIVS